MSVKVPKHYKLESTVDPKVFKKRKYEPLTIADLEEFTEGLSKDTVIWIATYHEDIDDILLRPLESLAASSNSPEGSYLTLG